MLSAMTSPLQLSDRLTAVHVSQARLAPDLASLIAAANLSLSTTQTSQLELTFLDADMALIAGGFLPKRTPVSYGGLALEVAVREIVTVNSAPAFKVTARASAIQRLKRATGARVWSGLSYTQWLASECAAVGAGFIGQASPTQTQVIRKADKGEAPESTWDTATRAASELGYILFEAAGVVYFGKPSWIVKTQARSRIGWFGNGAAGTHPDLFSPPSVRDSEDDQTNGLTGSLSCTIGLAETLMTGNVLELAGLGPFSAQPFLITDTSIDLADPTSVNTVSFATPLDPAPQPPTDSTSSGVDLSFELDAGVYAGIKIDQAQANNLAVTYTVGQEVGASDRDIEICFMAEMTESKARNLTGAPTDHTSRGILQQQDNWGSVAQRTNVATAVQLFFTAPGKGLFDKVPNRDRLPMGVVAQDVQVSAFPDRYAAYQAFAIAVMAAIHRAGG